MNRCCFALIAAITSAGCAQTDPIHDFELYEDEETAEAEMELGSAGCEGSLNLRLDQLKGQMATGRLRGQIRRFQGFKQRTVEAQLRADDQTLVTGTVDGEYQTFQGGMGVITGTFGPLQQPGWSALELSFERFNGEVEASARIPFRNAGGSGTGNGIGPVRWLRGLWGCEEGG